MPDEGACPGRAVTTRAWDSRDTLTPYGVPGRLARRLLGSWRGRTLRAVLFDMDGLLLDSEPLWSVAEAGVARRLGRSFGPEVKAAMVGNRIDVAVPVMLRMLESDADPVEVQAELLTRMAALFRERLPWQPGAVELLDALAGRGVPLGLVSSSYRVLVDAALETAGAGRFAVTVAGDEVRRPKPHPEPYLTAARRLGADPAACVVFEDSMTGIHSGEAAGCVCVGVPDVVPLEATPRRPVLSSLAEVDVDWLLALPARMRRVS